jgi:hypothetical protein
MFYVQGVHNKLGFIIMPNIWTLWRSMWVLSFSIWMLMSTMIGMVPYKSRARDVLLRYHEESLGHEESLPILMD